MTDWIRDLIEDRCKVYKTDGWRTDRWRTLKSRTKRIIKKRRSKFDAYVVEKLETDNNPGNFFKHVDRLLGANEKARWSPREMFPGMDAKDIAEEMASFFNAISNEYAPLCQEAVPVTFGRELPTLSNREVEERLKKAKKPSSMVPRDIPPALYNHYSSQLAKPLTAIFNKITLEQTWPDLWKREYVTIIPKNNSPSDPSQCRNISCTNFASKIYESFVLAWSRDEVKPKLNQYGGEPGASATQLLVEVMDDIATTLEDNRMGTVLSAIDFSKAFNRLEHSHCLNTFARRGSSTSVLRLLASFLSGRSMSVRVENVLSEPRAVNAGAPQGSVLGCYLFNIGVDDLEEEFEHTEPAQEEAVTETLCRSDDFPAVSTPKRVSGQHEPQMSPIAGRRQEVQLLPRVANAPSWILRAKDPRIKDRGIRSYKFVDDSVNTSPVNMRGAILLEGEGGLFKQIKDKRTKSLLHHIANNATAKGMRINPAKTSLMCVSAAASFEPQVQIVMDGITITGEKTMKILGVTLDNDGSFKTHVENIRRRLRQRTWALSKLRRRGVQEQKLVKDYTSLIRPVAEYASPAWNSLLTAEQSEKIERQQTQALKNIFGVGMSAAKMRTRANIELLQSRRLKASVKFVNKCVVNPRCAHWFEERGVPRYARKRGTFYPRYRERIARTDRFRF